MWPRLGRSERTSATQRQSAPAGDTPFEALEPRCLMSDAGTLAVSLKLSKSLVKESDSLTALVTVSNTGQQTVNAVFPTLTQNDGMFVLTKPVSPSIASIAPGKKVAFSYAIKELVVGNDVLTADVRTPFAASTGSASQQLSVMPRNITSTAVTDASGNAYLKLGSRTVPLHMTDQRTGSPIEGLTLSIAGADKSNSRAVLVAADKAGRYPLQISLLQGPAPTARAVATAPSESTNVGVRPGAGPAMSAAISAIESAFLPSVDANSPAPGLMGAVATALKNLATSKLPLPLPFAGTKPPKVIFSSGPIDPSAVLGTLRNTVLSTGFGLVLEQGLLVGLGEEPHLAPFALAATALTDLGMDAVEHSMEEETDAPKVEFKIESWGGFPVALIDWVADPHRPEIHWAQRPTGDVIIRPLDAQGHSLPGGSYELISKDDLSRNIAGVLDTGGMAEIPVELGDYIAQVSSPGYQTVTQGSLQVTSQGTAFVPTMNPVPAVSGTLTTALGQPTGFLDSGTQFYVTPHFFDANGHEIAVDLTKVRYSVHNPVGALVASVDERTGLVTMGPGFGAALVTATYNGVTTTARLLSTNGNHKYPVQSKTPFVLNPTSLHFYATQNGPSPASQAFEVHPLSSQFNYFHYTSSSGWLSVAPANNGTFNTFNVNANPTGLSPGDYTRSITVSDDATGYKSTIKVTLTIAPQPTPTLSHSDWTGNWTYPVFGFGDDNARLTLHLHQSGHNITGSWEKLVLDGSVNTPGETDGGEFYSGSLYGNSLVLTTMGGWTFNGTVSGNTITGTTTYLHGTGRFTVTAQ
jgi:hypothetical protein